MQAPEAEARDGQSGLLCTFACRVRNHAVLAALVDGFVSGNLVQACRDLEEMAPTMMAMKDIYESPGMVARYRRMAEQGLTIPEQYCLNLIPAAARGSILDIGIGGGRTTASLSEAFGKYIGVDYSEAMITAAKSRFPSADLRVLDARDLRLDDRFDCVMFSFNGIDSVAYTDRETIFRQIATVLRPDGYLIYSTHNIHFPRVSTWLNRLFVKELFQAWPRIHLVARSFVNRLRMYSQQSCNEEVPFAVVNDIGAEFGYLNVYVDIPQEIETTLRRAAFNVVATIGNTRQTAAFGSDDNWVYIVAQLIAET